MCGIVSLIINPAFEEDRGTAWIEGFAIIVSVIVVVVVTAKNNQKKEIEFKKLQEAAEDGKKVSIKREGVFEQGQKFGEVMVGDIIQLKGGM